MKIYSQNNMPARSIISTSEMLRNTKMVDEIKCRLSQDLVYDCEYGYGGVWHYDYAVLVHVWMIINRHKEHNWVNTDTKLVVRAGTHYEDLR